MNATTYVFRRGFTRAIWRAAVSRRSATLHSILSSAGTGAILGFAALATPHLAHGQPVVAPPPSTPTVPPALRPAAPPAATGTAPAAPAPARLSRSQTTPFYYGPFSLHPKISERFYFTNDLPSRSGRRANSYVNTLSPGFRLDIGHNWTVDYAALWTYYTNPSFRETIDHSLNAAGLLAVRGWLLQGAQGYSLMTRPMIETGRQTTSESVSSRVSLGRPLNRNWSVISSASQVLDFVSTSPDSYSWSTENALQYRFSSRLTLGTGAAAGYVDMDPGVNMAFVRPFGSVSWRPSDKLSFTAQAGEEIRQIYSRGVPARYTPVFSFSVVYSPFRHTQVNATAGRSVAPSVLRNQVNDSTNWTVSFSQRLLGHFNFSANYGETDSGYNAVNDRVEGGRRDQSYNYGCRLNTTVRRRGTIGLFFQGTHNSSNTAGFNVDSTQSGVEFSWSY